MMPKIPMIQHNDQGPDAIQLKQGQPGNRDHARTAAVDQAALHIPERPLDEKHGHEGILVVREQRKGKKGKNHLKAGE